MRRLFTGLALLILTGLAASPALGSTASRVVLFEEFTTAVG